MFAASWPRSADRGKCCSKCRQNSSNSSRSRPKFGRVWQYIGRNRPNFGRSRPKLALIRSMSAQFRAKSGRGWSSSAPKDRYNLFGPKDRYKFDRVRVAFARRGAPLPSGDVRVRVRPKQRARFRPKLGDFDLVWSAFRKCAGHWASR